MINFNIKDYLNRFNDFAKAGHAVYTDAFPIIEKGEEIVLDMQGVDGLPTVFFNTSLGQLMDELGIEQVRSSLRFKNILKTQAERLKKYFFDYSTLINHSTI